jgi:hypothetical protein
MASALETCPWSSLAPGTVHFCEERLCAWVVEPSNAWSSMAYVVLGLIMAVSARRDGIVGITIAAAQIMIGLGSFFFHGTGTFAGEVVDQIGMFMLSALVLCASLAQARGWSPQRTVSRYVAIVVASTAAIFLVRPLGIPIFAAQLSVGLGWQIALWRRSEGEVRSDYRMFFRALGVFLVSFSIWLTDITGLVCDPHNHLVTGHAIWHVLNAICVWRLASFYRRRLPR